MATEHTETEPAATGIVAWKGFDKNLQCRGYQYEVGQTYTHAGSVVRCASGGFHSCEHPLDVLGYYPPAAGARYARVTAAGEIDRAKDGDTKIASGSLTVEVEVGLPGLLRAAVTWVRERSGPEASTVGNRAHASTVGLSAIASSFGVDSTAKAEAGGAISLAAYEWNSAAARHVLKCVRSAMVGEDGVVAGKTYRLTLDRQFEEVAS